jgi:hypothetical protein
MKMQTLEESEMRQMSYVPPPQPSLNGGLFTGAPFKPNAPWANVPVVPDVDYMTNVNLRSANPPPQALYQYPGNTRPGNNYQANSGLKPYEGDRGFEGIPYNFSCIPANVTKPLMNVCKCRNISSISGNTFIQNECQCDKVIYMDV